MANNLPFSGEKKKRARKPLYPLGWGSGSTAYVATFQASSIDLINRGELEIGDKIILPESAMVAINKLRLPFPLIFEIRCFNKRTHNTNSESSFVVTLHIIV